MSSRIHKSSGFSEQGYVLLTLLLIVSLMIIATAVVVPTIAFEIRRAREEELVHRGVQYTRAIRLYSKRTGSYPVRLEQLLGDSQTRYIRKLYKDPITGGDFRLLHLGDVQPNNSPAQAPDSQDSADAPAAGDGSQPAAPPADPSSNPAQASVTSFSQSNSQSGFTQFAGSQNAAAQAGSSPFGSSQFGSSQFGASPLANAQPGAPGQPAQAYGAASPTTDSGDAQPGGQLIFGVASSSKAKSIRSFDHKEHYNEWWFFYDPRFDHGYEIKGPTSMNMPTFQNPAQLGQPASGSAGQQPQPFSQPQQPPSAGPSQTQPQ